MYGLATATTDPSMATMTTAMDTTTRVIQDRLRSRPAAAAAATASVTRSPSAAGPGRRRLAGDGVEPVQHGRVGGQVHGRAHVHPALGGGGTERGHGTGHIVGVHLVHREVAVGRRSADAGDIRHP